jgi:hypothetical protein
MAPTTLAPPGLLVFQMGRVGKGLMMNGGKCLRENGLPEGKKNNDTSRAKF